MALEVKAPSPGESVVEVEVGSWFVEDGAYVERDTRLAEILSDKATLDIYSEEAGTVHIKAAAGDLVAVDSVIATIDTSASAGAAPAAAAAAAKEETASAPAQPAASPAPAANPNYATGYPSASAQKMMQESGLAAESVSGTGRDGRVTKGDVIDKLKQPPAPPATAPPAANVASNGAAKAPSAAFSRSTHREKMSRLRRTLAGRLVSVKNETAMLTTFNEVDMTAIMEVRKKYKEAFKEKYGVGLGFMSFFTKACTESLLEFPQVNSYIDGEELVYHDYVDLGVAVSTERGLMVPVIRNAESLSLFQIEQSIGEMAGRARQSRLSIDDMMGGTFTITNGGVFGSLMSTPILNPPQSAILGMHKIEERAVVINGNIVARPMMYLALSYDHRVIDGKESVSFLVKVKEYLEDPVRMLLGM